MGSKRPVAKMPSSDEPLNDCSPEQPTSLEGSATRQLLKRIADALQVPASKFYNQISAVELSGRFETTIDTDIADECTALLHSYRRIRDPEKRRRILTLAQQVAEQA